MDDQYEMTLHVVTSLIETFADDQGNISKESFVTICNALFKAFILGAKIPGLLVEAIKKVLCQVCLSLNEFSSNMFRTY